MIVLANLFERCEQNEKFSEYIYYRMDNYRRFCRVVSSLPGYGANHDVVCRYHYYSAGVFGICLVDAGDYRMGTQKDCGFFQYAHC